jgi:hypothetical protein
MTLEVVAVWHGRLRPDLLARKARALCVLYNNAHCIWESNHHGLAFQIEFEKLYDDFYYRQVSQDSVAGEVTDKPGYRTTPRSRHLLFDILRRYVNDQLAPIRCPWIVDELSNVYYEDSARGNADFVRVAKYPGKSMDLLVALGLCLEAHRNFDPETVLAPLDDADVQILLQAKRQAYIARSMGLEGGELHPLMERMGATAKDLEDADELAALRERREKEQGFGSAV